MRKAGNEKAVVSAVLSGLGLGNDCTGDSARYNRGFLESGKQEPRKWDFRGRRKSCEGSGERVSNQEMEPAFKSGKQEIRKWDQRASCSPAFLIRKSPLSRKVRDREAAIISTRAACAPQATEFLIRKSGNADTGKEGFLRS